MVVIVRGVEKGACISSGKTLDILQYTIDIQDKKNLPTLASDFSTPLLPGSLARQCKNATAASVFLLRPTKAQPFL